ncbi:MAG: methyltransferase domain-containing protein [Gammaproteobacteria bacterium]
MADLFNEKAQDWDQNDMVTQLSKAIGDTILDQVVLEPHMQVMDFGAGTGLISSHVAPRVEKIVAVDISDAMLEKLVAKPELSGKVEAVCQDIIDNPLNAEFDLIVSAMAMHHVENTRQLFYTFASHLKPGAKVALADLDKEDGSFHPEDTEGVFHHGFERDSIQDMLKEHGFDEISFTTAHTVNKEDKNYPIFMVTATKK